MRLQYIEQGSGGPGESTSEALWKEVLDGGNALSRGDRTGREQIDEAFRSAMGLEGQDRESFLQVLNQVNGSLYGSRFFRRFITSQLGDLYRLIQTTRLKERMGTVTVRERADVALLCAEAGCELFRKGELLESEFYLNEGIELLATAPDCIDEVDEFATKLTHLRSCTRGSQYKALLDSLTSRLGCLGRKTSS